jgi:2-haloacid dehalogenase
MMTALKLYGIKACVFDAYGTLFDVNSASRAAQDSLGEKWQPLADLWRSKQLQYTWLRGLSGRHADFWQVTGDSLDFALATLQLKDSMLRDRLMKLYLVLDAYPEVPDMLKRLKAAGLKLEFSPTARLQCSPRQQPTQASPNCSTQFCLSRK